MVAYNLSRLKRAVSRSNDAIAAHTLPNANQIAEDIKAGDSDTYDPDAGLTERGKEIKAMLMEMCGW